MFPVRSCPANIAYEGLHPVARGYSRRTIVIALRCVDRGVSQDVAYDADMARVNLSDARGGNVSESVRPKFYSKMALRELGKPTREAVLRQRITSSTDP